MPVKSRNIQAREKKNKKNPPGALRSERFGKDPQRPLPQTKGEGAVIQGRKIGRRLREEAGGSVEVRRMGKEQFDRFLEQQGEPRQETEKEPLLERGLQKIEELTGFERQLKEGGVTEGLFNLQTQGVKIGLTAAATLLGGKIVLGTAGRGAKALLSRAAAGQAAKKVTQLTLTGGRIAVNTKNAARTASWLGKVVKNPAVIMGAIGSYPFAGFIKEEALQTLSFAYNSAKQNEDLEGMQAAIQEQKELLNPTAWDEIFASIPYANLLDQLKKFYQAALTKLEINEKGFEKMQAKLASEETLDPNIAEAQARRAG